VQKLGLLVIVASARVASADVTNPDYLPFGERAAMIGNAGICSPYGEAVYYNPANLTRIDHPSLSVSGSTYLRYDLSAKPLIVLQGEDQPFSASGFVAIPSTVTSTYKAGDWWLATAVRVPGAGLQNRTTLDCADLHVTILQQTGGACGSAGRSRKLGDSFAIGLPLRRAQTESQISFIRVQLHSRDGRDRGDIERGQSVLNLNAVLRLPGNNAGARRGVHARAPAIRLPATDLYSSLVTAALMNQINEQSIDGARHRDRRRPNSASASRTADHAGPRAGRRLRPTTPGTITRSASGRGHAHVRRPAGAACRHRRRARAVDAPWVSLGALYNRSAVKSPASGTF
jgi:hypothetical protein